MLTLGIETSCDETGVSLTEGRKVLSNVVTSSVHLHKKYGGVVPEIASRYHVEYIIEVLSSALKGAKRDLEDVELVAVTNGPGLVGALLTGISLAKSISYGLKLPIIGVNHILAHLYSAFLGEGKKAEFPFVGLVVSGGHTALFYCERIDRFRVLGQTQDDAAGEAFDKVAKLLGLGYPGGQVIEKAARRSRAVNRISFPKSYLGKDSLDFSFSGLKTAVLYYVNKLRVTGYPAYGATGGTGELRLTDIADICYAFQESALDVLAEKAVLAARMTGVSRIVAGGGVTANSRLREKMNELAKFSSLNISFPELKYCMDNAAMVGALGEELYRLGYRSDMYLSAEPNLEVN